MKTLQVSFLLLALFFSQIGCATSKSIQSVSTESFDTSDLLGGEAAMITITRVEGNGVLDQALADILRVENKRGKALKKGVYEPSQLELKLHQYIQSAPQFQALSLSLNPYDLENPKANASFSVDYSNTTTNEIEFIDGSIRRTYFLQLQMSFSLLDSEGRTAFATDTADFMEVHCIIEQDKTCVDQIFGNTFSLKTYWNKLLKDSTNKLMNHTYIGLNRWQNVLNKIATNVIINKSGEMLKLSKDANYTRHHKLAKFPYLFIKVRPVSHKKLIQSLAQNGTPVSKSEQKSFRNFTTTLFRHAVEEQLRKEISKSKNARIAGIFMVPDYSSSWFQDAVSRIVADAVNNDEFEEVMGEDGEFRQQLVSSARQYDKLCKTEDSIRTNDLCLNLLGKFGKSQINAQKEALRNVQKATQRVFAAAVLTDPKIKRKEDKANKRFYPHSLKPDNRLKIVEAESAEYERLINDPKSKKDDAFYRKNTALVSMVKLGKVMAKNVVKTYQEELLQE